MKEDLKEIEDDVFFSSITTDGDAVVGVKGMSDVIYLDTRKAKKVIRFLNDYLEWSKKTNLHQTLKEVE